MGRAIFISYRRDDSEGEAGRLFDDLVRAYGENSVFMDVAGISPGFDFRKAIDDNVSSCGVLLAMIGPAWTTIANGAGKRRLDDENDFVRLEIASALRRDIPVIPVLVHEARMPRPDDLPDNLKDLAYRNSVEITHARWNSDVQLLTRALAQYVQPAAGSSAETVHAAVPVQLPAPNPDPEPPASSVRSAPNRNSSTAAPSLPAAAPVKKSHAPLFVAAAAVIVLLIAGILFLTFHRSSGANPPIAAAPLSQSAPAVPASDGGPANAMAGTWTNPTGLGTNGVTRLQISAAGDQLTIHAWGKCEPVDCDWGEKSATLAGNRATAVWNFGEMARGRANGRVATVTIAPANNQLHVIVVNTYSDHPENRREFDFMRAQ